MRKAVNKKGFTLIELLVVVAIIGILAAIAIPQFAKYRERAAKSSAVSDARNLANAIEAYFTDYSTYPPSASVSGSSVDLGDAGTVQMSNNNSVTGYSVTGGSVFAFTVANSTYSKNVLYDSNSGGVDSSIW